MTRARLLTLLLLPVLGGCMWTAPPGRYSAAVATPAIMSRATLAPSAGIAARVPAAPDAALPADIAYAIEGRLAELERSGGACAEYGTVMEDSYRRGRISIRPYMWRVDGRLVSGQASPNGDMVLARDIDPLNVGVRTVDDVLWSVEHESAHIAFRIANGEWAGIDLADRYVRACRSAAHADAARDAAAERTHGALAVSDR